MRNTRPRPLLLILFALFILIQLPAFANGVPVTVSVGYADNIHCPTFISVGPASCVSNPPMTFPNPWMGSSGISQFIGEGVEGVGFDAGALLLTNNSGGAVTVSDVTVTVGTGNTFELWGSFTIPVGESVILTQTFFDPTTLVPNFDTSDLTGCCTNDHVIPSIAITIGGTTTTLQDTNQILNTGGFDLGCITSDCVTTNESHPWSLIPGQVTVSPEPSSLLTLGSGLLFLGLGVRRKLRC